MKNLIFENKRANDLICNFLEIEVSYNTDLDKMEEIVKDEIRNHLYYVDKRTEEEKETKKEDIGFLVTEYMKNGIKVRISVWSKAENGFYLCCDLRRKLLKIFKENGIEIPYPHMQILK